MSKMVDQIENMNKRTRLILSLVGISAVIVPAILLFVLSKNTQPEPQIENGKRTVDSQNIGNTVSKVQPTPSPIPSPKQATTSASPSSATGSAR